MISLIGCLCKLLSKKESPKEVITIQKDENSKSEYPFRKKSSKSEQKGEVVKHPRQMIPDSPLAKSTDNYHNSV
jgi:hypothetical protein